MREEPSTRYSVAMIRLGVCVLASLLLAATARAAGPPFRPPATLVLFGRVESLKPAGSRFVMRFDPALLLSGKTASDWALATTGSRDVPNDHLIFDPEHSLLTYYVRPDAKVTVVGNEHGIVARRISVRQLVRVLHHELKTFEPDNPFWVVVSGDTALELDQQYTP
jgi:hypothetical protein